MDKNYWQLIVLYFDFNYDKDKRKKNNEEKKNNGLKIRIVYDWMFIRKEH